MADYFPLLARAVATLSDSTPETPAMLPPIARERICPRPRPPQDGSSPLVAPPAAPGSEPPPPAASAREAEVPAPIFSDRARPASPEPVARTEPAPEPALDV